MSAQLLAIDISGIWVEPEPAGRGWQAHVEDNLAQWSRGDTQDEAVGSLIRRLALEHEGANWQRSAWITIGADPGVPAGPPIAEPCLPADRPPTGRREGNDDAELLVVLAAAVRGLAAKLEWSAEALAAAGEHEKAAAIRAFLDRSGVGE